MKDKEVLKLLKDQAYKAENIEWELSSSLLKDWSSE